MSSEHPPEPQNPRSSPPPDPGAAAPDDSGKTWVPDDSGKTWVPDERDDHLLPESEVSGPAPDTDFGSQASAAADTPEDTQSEDPPQSFGEYELLERIGGGGMGNVYKALHRRLDRVVALKTLRAGSAKCEQQLERFHREAKAAARLDHPNIVPCYEFGKINGWHYLTMAFVPGESLQTRLTKGPLEPLQAARIVLDLAKAVDHCHDQGVIHRDIKPGNVILGTDGRPRLTDFGIAKLLNVAGTQLPTQLTFVGQVLGTPGYMSPEQSAGRRWEVSHSADIYGLGGLLVAALTGHNPNTPDSVQTLAQNVPESLQMICSRCMAFRPQDRFDEADDLVEALEAFLAGETATVPAPTPAEAPPKEAEVVITLPRSGLWKIAVAAAAVLTGVLVLGIWMGGWFKTSADPASNTPRADSPSKTAAPGHSGAKSQP